MIRKIAQGVFKAVVVFVATTLFFAVLKEPLEQKVIPPIIKGFSLEQALYLYSDPSADADDKYEFLVPRVFLASGIMIQDVSVAERDRGKDAPRMFKVKGTRADRLMTFIYQSANPANSMSGTFVGDQQDTKNAVYIGTLTGLSHAENEDCVLTTFWAVLGPVEDREKFGDMLRKALKRHDPVAQLIRAESSATTPCNESRQDQALLPSK